jgi:DNA-binding transcriptional regulator/RsmH inhibitor MraZ
MKNILFIGTYQRKVDSKGRLSIPAEWRKQTNWFYRYDDKFFSNQIDLIDCFSQTSIQDILPDVIKYNCDPEGRVIIKSQIGKTATLKGCGDYFVIDFLD